MENSLLLTSNPGAGYRAHKREIDLAVANVLESGFYILGEQVAAFENEFARYVGAGFCLGVGSGTDALEIAFRACGIGAGDLVITVSHTAVATAAAIELAGAKPILVDIDPVTFTIDPARLEDTVKLHLGKGLKAIVPVHLYGHPADMSAVLEIARRHGLFVIEDCSQAHGATYQGSKVGTLGHCGTFSFYPTKNLGTFGDGGAVVTSDSGFFETAKALRQYGWHERYISEVPGLNKRLDELHAAILRAKLTYLEQDNQRRRAIADKYQKDLPTEHLRLPTESDGVRHVYHQYVIASDRRDDLRSFLSERMISTAVLYPVPIHLQPAYKDRVALGAGGLENTEQVCRQILSLPMYPELNDEQTRRVLDAIISWDAAI